MSQSVAKTQDDGGIVKVVIECRSWDDFKNRVRRDHAEEWSALDSTEYMLATYPLFRGHARTNWTLASQWERKLASMRKTAPDRDRAAFAPMLAKVLDDFKDLAVGLPNLQSKDLSELDWWAIGRHHGLITPLLDWSRSPYVAAFFAFTGFAEEISPGVQSTGDLSPTPLLFPDSDTKIAIWALKVGPGLERAKQLSILNPHIDIGHRQRAQRGVFTRLDHETHLDLEAYLLSLGLDTGHLRQYLVPAHETAKALTELRHMNLTFATLFPDLQGAAQQANFETAQFALSVLAQLGEDD